MTNDEFVIKLMRLLIQYDAVEDLFWHMDGTDIKPLVNTNDFFGSGADSEEICPEDLPLLELSFSDLDKMGKKHYGTLLFASRKQNLEPWRLERWHETYPVEMVCLFEEPHKALWELHKDGPHAGWIASLLMDLVK